MILATIAADLLPALCDPANFADDGLRLIYADACEEAGEPDRAEFVRVQVELARPRQRCRCRGCYPRSKSADRSRCRLALRRRERELQAPGRRWWSDYGPGDRVTVLSWRRGFVFGVALTCADFLRHGPALVRLQPVEVVRLSDREPYGRNDYFGWSWAQGEGPDCPPWHLPEALHARLGPRPPSLTYGTRAEAEAVLSAACLFWSRDTEPTS